MHIKLDSFEVFYANMLLYGADGALGKALLENFNRAGLNTWIVSLRPSNAKNSILVNGKWTEDLKFLTNQFKKSDMKFDAIINVAGGWSGSTFNSHTEDIIFDVEQMMKKNFFPTIIVATLSAKFLNSNGLVVFTGANAARSATPSMVGYGASKAATHQIAQSLAMELKENGTVITLLPTIIDTESNRKSMPNSNRSTWTDSNEIATKILDWITNPPSRPKSGEMFAIKTSHNITAFEPVNTQY